MVERLYGRMVKGLEKPDRISVGLLCAAIDWRLRAVRAFMSKLKLTHDI